MLTYAQTASEPASHRVMLADPHPLVVEGLARLLNDAPNVGVVHRSYDGASLLDALLRQPADLLILDSRLAGPAGLEVLEQARQQGIGTATILFTNAPSDDEILQAIRLGIRGLISKDAAVPALIDCVRAVLAGGTCLDQALVGRAMAAMLTREAALRQLARELTVRQLEVVQLIVSGLRTKQVAERLFVSEGTLKVHLHHIYEKLNVSGRAQLVQFAQSRGLC